MYEFAVESYVTMINWFVDNPAAFLMLAAVMTIAVMTDESRD